MEKITLGNNAFTYPMPMTLIGSVVDGKPNFAAVAWVTRVNFQPPLIAAALFNKHYSNKGILENDQFSVNIPSVDIIEKTDCCGIVSGEDCDKSGLFDIYYGVLKNAPLIRECPLSMECKVFDVVELPADTLFIGEIMGVYTEEKYLTDGKPDIRKMHIFSLTMPDNKYWSIGEDIAQAWSIGKPLAKKIKQ